VASAGRLPQAPADFVDRANGVLTGLGTKSEDLAAAITRAAQLFADVRDACNTRR
jgi:hypothetical protein